MPSTDQTHGRPLDGKVVLVTGASGGGVGSVTARLLGARGATVVVAYHQNRGAADRVVAEIAAGEGRALAVQADIGEQCQVERMVAEVIDAYGRVDVLVSNASIGFPVGSVTELTWEQFGRGALGRLKPAFLLTQAVLPVMRKQRAGRLIYVGTEHADGPAVPGMIVNGTGAAALVAFVRYLAHELGPLGITANVVSPAGIDSAETARTAAAIGLPSDFRRRVAAAVPLGRMATPQDVAGVIAFFACQDAAFMTGTVAHVNGGVGIARITQGMLAPTEATPPSSQETSLQTDLSRDVPGGQLGSRSHDGV